MYIPLGRSYISEQTVVQRKELTCEHCSFRFFFDVVGSGSGTGASLFYLDNKGAERRASQAAEMAAQAALADAIELVPCPSCGRFQSGMVTRIRRNHHRWMRFVGWALLIASLIAAPFSASTPWTGEVAALGGFIGFGMLLTRRKLSQELDPNSDGPLRWASARGFTPGQEAQCDQATKQYLTALHGAAKTADLVAIGILSVALMSLGIGFSIATIGTAIGAERSQTWPTTPGRVRVFDIARVEDPPGRTRLVPQIEYEYRIDETDFIGRRFSMDNDPSIDPRTVSDLQQQLRPGAEVQVHYSPNNPAESTLVPGGEPRAGAFCLSGFFMAGGLIAGIYVLREWRRTLAAHRSRLNIV